MNAAHPTSSAYSGVNRREKPAKTTSRPPQMSVFRPKKCAFYQLFGEFSSAKPLELNGKLLGFKKAYFNEFLGQVSRKS